LEIVVNTRLLIKDKLEGIGQFSYETLKIITTNNPDVHFYFLFDRDFDEEFIFSENITPIVLSPKARHPFLFIWWFEVEVAAILNKIKPDLFLSPDGYLSLRANCKQLPVIHDINFEHFKGSLPWLVQKYYTYFFPRFAKKATRIATVSEFSKNDISTTYKIEKNKIDVVFNGVAKHFYPISEEEKTNVKQKLSNNRNYFFYIGSLHPRKNILNLIKAFEIFKEKTSSDFKLVLAGESYFWNTEMKEFLTKKTIKENVIFTGRISDQEASNFLAASFGLVYVPFFEGFGIPIIEAFNCHVPVITSNTSSMPEVANGAALLANPYDINSIAKEMENLVLNESIRAGLIEKGKIRARDFSSKKTADLLWSCIVKTINE
jgi:glycosyltransferase involved in cell wall biosynthesis